MSEHPLAGRVKALAFDVFGTVVDWRGSIIRETAAFGEERGIDADWTGFADAWRAGYRPAMQQVRTGALPWLKIDALHTHHSQIAKTRIEGTPISEIAQASAHFRGVQGRVRWAEGFTPLRLFINITPESAAERQVA